jgi:hypothetical protein
MLGNVGILRVYGVFWGAMKQIWKIDQRKHIYIEKIFGFFVTSETTMWTSFFQANNMETTKIP